MTTCILVDAKLSNKFWGKTVLTATYFQNSLPTKHNTKIAFGLWHDRIPSEKHIRILKVKLMFINQKRKHIN